METALTCRLSSLQGHFAGSCSAWCSPGYSSPGTLPFDILTNVILFTHSYHRDHTMTERSDTGPPGYLKPSGVKDRSQPGYPRASKMVLDACTQSTE